MPLFWLCIAFILGLLSSVYLHFPDILWLSLSVLFAIGSWFEKRLCPDNTHPLLSRPFFRIPFCLILIAFVLGAWRFQSALPEFSKNDLARYSNNENIILIGKVISYPQESTSATTANIEAQYISMENEFIEIKGKLELRLPAGFNLTYGDVLLLEGPLGFIANSESKPFQHYLSRKGIYNRMYYPKVTFIEQSSGNWLISWIYNIRENSLERIYNQIPFPESALLSGILLGTDWLIPSIYQDAYRSCGLIHIIAISGFNIALISNFIIKLTRRFLTPGKAGFFAIAAITMYTVMVGAEPAVVRAALMGCLSIPASYLGRRSIPIHSLIITGTLMLVENPFLLWDASFQLSFLACLGLITMADPIQNFINRIMAKFLSESTSSWWKPIISLIVTTLVAQFAVLPVILKMNDEISIYSLPANITVLPVQPILMGLGALSVVSGWFVPIISRFIAMAAWPFLAYCNRLAFHFGFLPDAEAVLPSCSSHIVFFMVPLTLLLFSILHVRKIGGSHTTDKKGV